ncbi:MAG: hypothetical protein ACKOZL_02065 [Actinomycetes bacterium]
MRNAVFDHLNIVWNMITGDVGEWTPLVRASAKLLGGLLGGNIDPIIVP